jgi:hypothetical protein
MLGLGSAMRDEISIWARTAESDDWAVVATGARAALTELDARGRRRTDVYLDPEITHVARVPLMWEDELVEGRRIVRTSDGAEFVIGPRQVHDEPPERHVRLYLKAAAAVTEG